MSPTLFLAVDAGPTGVTALLISDRPPAIARGHQQFPQHFPSPASLEPHPRHICTPTLPPLPLAAHACGGPSTGSLAGSDPGSIAITSGNSTCAVAKTSFDAGKVTFDVRNTGKDVTEVYVYAKGSDGAFDKVVGEVENVAPGLSRSFGVSVGAGDYEVACKPGQKGDGIRTALTVTGAAATTESTSAYDREVTVTAKEFAFTGLADFTAKVGEKIEFKLANAGTTEHELEILDPRGTNIGEVGPTAPDKGGDVVVSLLKAGTYPYLCGLADHADSRRKGTFECR